MLLPMDTTKPIQKLLRNNSLMNIIPILQLQSNLIASIQTELTDEEALAFQSALLEKNQQLNTKGIIIDVSMLDVIDSYMAKVLSDLTTMVKLQGAKVVLCGVQPAVASTLVDMGMRLNSIDTFLSLDHAFAYLTKEQSSNMEE
jgi:rsbT antagonist protein RsbS